jgi:hypothetical protein
MPTSRLSSPSDDDFFEQSILKPSAGYCREQEIQTTALLV